MNQRSTHSARVAVVGGGLAGLAAGSVLAHSGFHVKLPACAARVLHEPDRVLSEDWCRR